MQGERDTSTNPSVLVSRVCTGRSGATKLRHWTRNGDPVPLPLLMTIPVSFERRGNSAVAALPSIRSRRALEQSRVEICHSEL